MNINANTRGADNRVRDVKRHFFRQIGLRVFSAEGQWAQAMLRNTAEQLSEATVMKKNRNLMPSLVLAVYNTTKN